MGDGRKWALDCFGQILNKGAVFSQDRAIKEVNATSAHLATSVHLRENHTMPHLTWSSAFSGHQMPVSGGTQYVRVGGNGQPSYCFMASATPAICGCLSLKRSSKSTRSSFPTCGGWAVIGVAAVEPHGGTVPADDNSVAVMLDFVDPVGTGRRS
jgi:hypothetical protein